jgi:hypothetical protein
MIDTTTTANVTPSVVTCNACKQLVKQSDAWSIGLLAPTGKFRNGREVMRVTGETIYQCDDCFTSHLNQTA